MAYPPAEEAGKGGLRRDRSSATTEGASKYPVCRAPGRECTLVVSEEQSSSARALAENGRACCDIDWNPGASQWGAVVRRGLRAPFARRSKWGIANL
jgi:hypothetical protein